MVNKQEKEWGFPWRVCLCLKRDIRRDCSSYPRLLLSKGIKPKAVATIMKWLTGTEK